MKNEVHSKLFARTILNIAAYLKEPINEKDYYGFKIIAKLVIIAA